MSAFQSVVSILGRDRSRLSVSRVWRTALQTRLSLLLDIIGEYWVLVAHNSRRDQFVRLAAVAVPMNAAIYLGFPEKVDAYYYPDKSNLSFRISRRGLASVEECRRVISDLALEHNDPLLQRGEYECGVGYIQEMTGGLTVYRTAIR